MKTCFVQKNWSTDFVQRLRCLKSWPQIPQPRGVNRGRQNTELPGTGELSDFEDPAETNIWDSLDQTCLRQVLGFVACFNQRSELSRVCHKNGLPKFTHTLHPLTSAASSVFMILVCTAVSFYVIRSTDQG